MTTEWTPQFDSHRDLAFFKFVPSTMMMKGGDNDVEDSNDDSEDLIKSGIVMFSHKSPTKLFEDEHEAVQIDIGDDYNDNDNDEEDQVGGGRSESESKGKGKKKRKHRHYKKKGESVYAIPVAYFVSIETTQQPSKIQYDYEDDGYDDGNMNHQELSSDIFDQMLSNAQIHDDKLEREDYLQSKLNDIHLENETRDDGVESWNSPFASESISADIPEDDLYKAEPMSDITSPHFDQQDEDEDLEESPKSPNFDQQDDDEESIESRNFEEEPIVTDEEEEEKENSIKSPYSDDDDDDHNGIIFTSPTKYMTRRNNVAERNPLGGSKKNKITKKKELNKTPKIKKSSVTLKKLSVLSTKSVNNKKTRKSKS